MTRLDALIDAWRAAYCPAGGDPDAARWWDRWFEQFWIPGPDSSADCDAVSSHQGGIHWRETESGLIGRREGDRTGHYLIPAAVQVAGQLTDDAWFSNCEEERCPSFPMCDVLTNVDSSRLVHLLPGPTRPTSFAEFASAGDTRRFKPNAA